MSNVSLIDGHIDEPTITDEQIIEALSKFYDLELLIEPNLNEKITFGDVLDLINRQKAEIAELTEKVEALGDPIESAQYELFELREENRELHKICNQAIKLTRKPNPKQ